MAMATAMSIHASKAMIEHCFALAVLAVLAGQVAGQTRQYEGRGEVCAIQPGQPAGSHRLS